MPTLELFYDIASPYSYLASTQVEGIAADVGAKLVWRPFLLGGVFKATGNTMPAANPTRARYLLKDLTRWAAYYRVPFTFPTRFPLNTVTTMRVLTALEGDERTTVTHELYRAYWVEGRDVGDRTELTELVGAERVEAAEQPEVKAALRSTTDEAVGRGAFGAPALFIGDELYFGNDRLPFVQQRLRELTGA